MIKRYFNIAGPCNRKEHYMVDVFERGGNEILGLIKEGHYYVIHAARQSGKTTLLWELADRINAEGEYYALYCSMETLQEFREHEKGLPEIVRKIEAYTKQQGLPEGFAKNADYNFISGVLNSALSDYCRSLDKPLVIFFDEADCLSNGTLITFLRQLREGFISRARVPFVHSIALVGMRNIRDYKAQVRPENQTLGTASPFNIVTETLTLPVFTPREVTELYAQHTKDTGQIFEPPVIDYILEQSNGQPWLVNAIVREVIVKLLKNDYSKPITKELAETAIQNLILNRPAHFDSLLERLKEPRIRKVIEPLVTGTETVPASSDDYLFARDLGLIKEKKGQPVVPANPIYAEIIVRFLNEDPQKLIEEKHTAYTIPRYLKDGKIDMNYLLSDFQAYWRENSEIWKDRYEKEIYQYAEAAPHLVLQAFLQRVVNGGAQIIREMALGSMRADLCIIYEDQKYPIEIKLLYDSNTIKKGLEQTYNYMTKCGVNEGWLVVFDKDTQKPWEEKIYMRTETFNGKNITVVGV